MSGGKLESLIQALLDGVITPEESVCLQNELQASDEARRVYIRHVRLHTALRQRSRSIRTLQGSQDMRLLEMVFETRRTRVIRSTVMAMAAIIMVCLVSLWWFRVVERPPMVTIRTGPATLYTVSHADGRDDGGLGKGSRLNVSQGSVQLVYASGVESIITAPASIVFNADDRLLMKRGEAWFRVPPGAHGFQVETEGLSILDLGTEFGVRAGPDWQEVHVIRGKVQVTSLGDSSVSEVLNGDTAVKNDFYGDLVSIPCQPSAFLTSLPLEVVSYDGALDLGKAVYYLGQGGTTYVVTNCLGVDPNPVGAIGDMVIHEGGEVAVSFSQPVDLMIHPPRGKAKDSGIWNSTDDFGQIIVDDHAQVTLVDPAGEISLKQVGPGVYRWMFLPENNDRKKLPSAQSWGIELIGTNRITIAKHQGSEFRAEFHMHVTSPSGRSSDETPGSPISGEVK